MVSEYCVIRSMMNWSFSLGGVFVFGIPVLMCRLKGYRSVIIDVIHFGERSVLIRGGRICFVPISR